MRATLASQGTKKNGEEARQSHWDSPFSLITSLSLSKLIASAENKIWPIVAMKALPGSLSLRAQAVLCL